MYTDFSRTVSETTVRKTARFTSRLEYLLESPFADADARTTTAATISAPVVS